MSADTNPVDDAIGVLGFLCTWAVVTILWTFTSAPMWVAVLLGFCSTVVVACCFCLLCLWLTERFDR